MVRPQHPRPALRDEPLNPARVLVRADSADDRQREVSPVGFAEPGPTEADRIAHRLWLLHREELRARYERLGVAVASWREGEPLDAALEGVKAFRRHARLARA